MVLHRIGVEIHVPHDRERSHSPSFETRSMPDAEYPKSHLSTAIPIVRKRPKQVHMLHETPVSPLTGIARG